MERGRRQGIATFFAANGLADGSRVALDEAAAHHARVRRLEVGADVRVTDGRGTVGFGRIARLAKSTIEIEVEERSQVPPLDPLVLLVPVADRDRMLWLAEKAAELAVTRWQPVLFERSRSVSPRGEGVPFAEKVRARMRAAIEQSGGAWLPDVVSELAVDEAVQVAPETSRILLDAAGEPMLALRPRGAIAVTVGPEGGLETHERDAFLDGGWVAASLGTTTLRFETAGIAAAAIARASQRA